MNGLCAGFIGLGLIGGSIAQALKYYYPDIHILAHTRSQKTLDYALSNGIIDEACEPGPAFAACDYIFLCAPVENNISYPASLKALPERILPFSPWWAAQKAAFMKKPPSTVWITGSSADILWQALKKAASKMQNGFSWKMPTIF